MTPDQAKSKAKTLFFGEVNEGELAVRMCEAALEIKRPPGMSLAESLDAMPADWGPAFLRAAKAAMTYWQECLQKASQPS